MFAELFTCFPAARLLVSHCRDPEAALRCLERPRPRPDRRPGPDTGAKPTLENNSVDSSLIEVFPNDWTWKKYDSHNCYIHLFVCWDTWIFNVQYKYTRIYTYCCPACLLSSLCCLNNLELFNNSSSSSFHRKCIKTPKYALFLWLVSEIHAMFTKLGNYAVAVNAQNILGQRKNRRREG